MYIKYVDFKGSLNEDETLLMSHDEFVNGGKMIEGVPVAVTPYGEEPIEQDEDIYALMETTEWKPVEVIV